MDVGEPRHESVAWVRTMQAKLHQWAQTHKEETLRSAWGLVTHRSTLAEAWRRLSQNQGSKTAGIDGETRRSVEERGVDVFLQEVRASLRAGRFHPLPVREHRIPKPGKKDATRRLGIPVLRDRLVQMALKLVLEPIFEADFQPCSYGFRPGRSPHDAQAEVRFFGGGTVDYPVAIEGDIRSCFDRIDHDLLTERLGRRVRDQKVLRLIRAFLKAGILTPTGLEPTREGTPQGGVLSPLLANVLLDGLDQAYAKRYHDVGPDERKRIRRNGGYVCHLVRYADDFVVLVKGTREQAEAERAWLAGFLRDELHLELHPEKTRVTPLSEGIDFLGFTLRRVPWKEHSVVIAYPSRKSLARVMGKVRDLTGPSTYGMGFVRACHAWNRVLRGWSAYFRYGASSRTFGYLRAWTWHRVERWLHGRHPGRPRTWVYGHYGGPNWHTAQVALFRVESVGARRYYYRGYRIPLPWAEAV